MPSTTGSPRIRFEIRRRVGAGIGDTRFMLESRDLGGKCADLNALFVGLARAAGLPARDVYGLRVARSELGYRSLGTASANVTKAQHCHAEVHLDGLGWVRVDPANVRIAYNFAHDVSLPGSARSPIGSLMYPQAETQDGRIDSLDPGNFSYRMTSREIGPRLDAGPQLTSRAPGTLRSGQRTHEVPGLVCTACALPLGFHRVSA
jgi:hypothetical protein